MNILFVCRANMQRSQMAEAFFNASATAGFQATSAGTQTEGRQGLPLDTFQGELGFYAIECMKEKGIDISRAVIKSLTPELVDEVDRIVVMAEPETIPPYLKASNKAIYWDIPDPGGQSYAVHLQTRNRIEQLVQDLAEDLHKGI